MRHDRSPAIDAPILNPQRQFLLRHIGFDIEIAKAHGHYYHCTDGTAYLDFLAQYGAVPFGHNPAPLWEAIHAHGRAQAPTLMQPLLSPHAERLARALVAVAPGAMRHATFANSGAETVEAAIKLARARTGRQVILTVTRGFHGKTLGALSATENPAYRAPFRVDTTCFEHVAFNDLPALEARLARDDVAAFIVEPVQGEGGMREHGDGYLSAAAHACHRHGTLFVLDEIQTGLGRTGTLFAAEAEPGLAPDVMLLSKALGGGLVPLGVMLCTESAWCEDFGYLHSSTFANNGLACAVGSAVIDLLLHDGRALVRRAAEMGQRLAHGLDEIVGRHPDTFPRRSGRGLMQGLALAPWSGEDSYFAAHATERGFAVPLVAGYLLKKHRIVTAAMFNQVATLRLQPSLTIEATEVDRMLEALDDVGRLVGSGRVSGLLHAVALQETHVPPTPPAASRHAPTYQVPQPQEHRRGGFAFLIHPTDADVLFGTLPRECAQLNAAAKDDLRAWMRSWFCRMYDPAAVYHLPALRSRQGGYVEGWLIAAPLTPAEMLRLPPARKRELLAAYLDVARGLNVDIVGLGAFTSIIARGGVDLPNPGVHLTTGNSLTAIASAESLHAAFQSRGRLASSSHAAVIGAAGSLGRLAALHLSRFFGRLTLFGNPSNPHVRQQLQAVGDEIYRMAVQRALRPQVDAGLPRLLREMLDAPALRQLAEMPAGCPGTESGLREAVERHFSKARRPLPLGYSADPARDLGQVEAVLSASSAGKAFLEPEVFASGAVVCDVARPLDVLSTLRERRPDVTVYEGGVLRLPEDVAFGAQNVLGYPRGHNLACLSETIALCMEGATRSHSLGSCIDYDEALDIHQMSRAHGFEIAQSLPGPAALAARRPPVPA
jgi:acetylornithine/succinyldiaminopimelate/putrescine aminotransferase/predicted amino acid dehydrogenase